MLPDTNDFCRLVLLRHPELDPACQNLAVGGGEAPLGRRGQAQVLRWLEVLRPVPLTAVFSGGQPQCLDPARALAADRKLQVQQDARLLDQDMGSWQGRAWDELVRDQGAAVQEFFANFGESAAPGGESLGGAVERMLDWWRSVAPESLGKTLAVVTSGGLIAGFASAMLGMRLSRSVSMNLPHGGIGMLDCFANGVRVASWNPTALDQL